MAPKLPAWIIDHIERDRREHEKQRPALELPLPSPRAPSAPERPEEPKSRVIVIDLQGSTP